MCARFLFPPSSRSRKVPGGEGERLLFFSLPLCRHTYEKSFQKKGEGSIRAWCAPDGRGVGEGERKRLGKKFAGYLPQTPEKGGKKDKEERLQFLQPEREGVRRGKSTQVSGKRGSTQRKNYL